jgi:hypothetical protein
MLQLLLLLVLVLVLVLVLLLWQVPSKLTKQRATVEVTSARDE